MLALLKLCGLVLGVILVAFLVDVFCHGAEDSEDLEDYEDEMVALSVAALVMETDDASDEDAVYSICSCDLCLTYRGRE